MVIAAYTSHDECNTLTCRAFTQPPVRGEGWVRQTGGYSVAPDDSPAFGLFALIWNTAKDEVTLRHPYSALRPCSLRQHLT